MEISHCINPDTGKFLCGRNDGRTGLQPWPLGTIREVIIKDITCPECLALLPVAKREQMEEALANL
jgi:hypothetical protein